MSRLTVERGQEIIKQNKQILYHLPDKYENLRYYIGKGRLRQTLLDVLNFVQDKQIIIDQHKYMFFLADKTLNLKARKKIPSATGNRHINLLCAIGLFEKVYQDSYHKVLIDVNKNFLENNPDRKAPINVFAFRIWSAKELQRCEERAGRLQAAGVTTGNVSNNYLRANSLEDMAQEIYPKNNSYAPYVKDQEYKELIAALETCIESFGYCTVQMLKDNLVFPDKELDQVRRIYKRSLAERYYYKRPTKNQMEEWGLKDLKYIYTRKEEMEL